MLETIIASVIILITYGYFIITYIQINRPDKKSIQIQSWYEQQIICDSLESLTNSAVDSRIDVYEITYSTNTYGNNFIKAVKENTSLNFVQYKSFTAPNE